MPDDRILNVLGDLGERVVLVVVGVRVDDQQISVVALARLLLRVGEVLSTVEAGPGAADGLADQIGVRLRHARPHCRHRLSSNKSRFTVSSKAVVTTATSVPFTLSTPGVGAKSAPAARRAA